MASEFCILGELEARVHGEVVDVGSPQQRELLARLLISRGETVPTDRLLEDLWGDEPPESARHTLQSYVSRLRRALGSERGRLEHRRSGYRLHIDPGELDADRFERLVDAGRTALAGGDASSAKRRLEEALGLWRGAALAEFTHESFARGECARLEELRLDALEQRLWADLALGRHGEVVNELRNLVIAHPFRETLWEQLMVALYRSGRQVEALRVFGEARVKLCEELGIEPGPALALTEERILRHDPCIDLDGGGDEEITTPAGAPPSRR